MLDIAQAKAISIGFIGFREPKYQSNINAEGKRCIGSVHKCIGGIATCSAEFSRCRSSSRPHTQIFYTALSSTEKRLKNTSSALIVGGKQHVVANALVLEINIHFKFIFVFVLQK